MLLTEQEIISFPLNQRAVDDYTAQVINTLNGIENPVERYVVARLLKKIFDKACEDCGAAAEAYCEKENIGSDGKEFELYSVTKNPAHKGVWTIRQFDMDYNYAANATNVKGKRIPYKETLREIQYYDDQLKSNKKILKGYKEQIKLAHPNMVPEVVRVVFKLTSIPDGIIEN